MGRLKDPPIQAYAVYLRGDETYRMIVFEQNEVAVYNNVIRVVRRARDKVRMLVRDMDIRGELEKDARTGDPVYLNIQMKDIFANRFDELDGEYRGHAVMDWNDPEDRIALVRVGWTCMEPGRETCMQCAAAEVCPQAVME